MLHAPALPGSPRFAGDMQAVRAHVLADARTLVEGGVDGLMIENFGDVPFFKGRVPAETVASLTALACAVREVYPDTPLGINVLRNDAESALSVAAACGADYVRVNVLSGAMVTDQGLIEGKAAEVMRLRSTLGLSESTQVWADVAVKHAAGLVERPIGEQAEELVERAGADAVIVTGSGTGKPADPELAKQVKAAAGGRPVLVGSGVDECTIATWAAVVDGMIVGTAFKPGGDPQVPVSEDHVSRLLFCFRDSL